MHEAALTDSQKKSATKISAAKEDDSSKPVKRYTKRKGTGPVVSAR